MTGTYDPALVALSYAIAVMAAYVALNLASRMLRSQGDPVVWRPLRAAPARFCSERRQFPGAK